MQIALNGWLSHVWKQTNGHFVNTKLIKNISFLISAYLNPDSICCWHLWCVELIEIYFLLLRITRKEREAAVGGWRWRRYLVLFVKLKRSDLVTCELYHIFCKMEQAREKKFHRSLMTQIKQQIFKVWKFILTTFNRFIAKLFPLFVWSLHAKSTTLDCDWNLAMLRAHVATLLNALQWIIRLLSLKAFVLLSHLDVIVS